MTPPRDVRELVGDDVPDDELARLARVHELLREAGPPPELPPALAQPPRAAAERGGVRELLPRRRREVLVLVAATIAAVFFGVGYAIRGGEGYHFEAIGTAPPMVGVGQGRGASASLRVGRGDRAGNWEIDLRVRDLAALPGAEYYTLYLSRRNKPIAPCGSFRVVGSGATHVRMSVAYNRKRFDGWVVTREVPRGRHPGELVMITKRV